jgi:hypothetical protein
MTIRPFLFAAVVWAGCASGDATAALLVYEPFAYTVNEPLDGKGAEPGPHIGFASGSTWNQQDGADLPGNSRIEEGSLRSGELQTTGDRVVLVGDPEADLNSFQRAINPISGATGSELWVSFLVRREAGTSAADLFALQLIGQQNDALEIGYIGDARERRLGLAFRSGVTEVSSRSADPMAGIVNGLTRFLVVRIGFDLGGNEEIQLFLNPTPGQTTPGTPLLTENRFNIDGFRTVKFFAGFEESVWSFDELRLGTTYGSVAPIPEPGSALQLGMAVLICGARRWRKLARS